MKFCNINYFDQHTELTNTPLINSSPDYKKRHIIYKVAYTFFLYWHVILGPVAQTVRQSTLMHIYYISLLENSLIVLLFPLSFVPFSVSLSVSVSLGALMVYNAKGRMPTLF